MSSPPPSASDSRVHGTPTPADELIQGRRDRLRRRLLRANTAVAVILITVSALAIAAVFAGLRAERSQRRAEQAELESRDKLWKSHLEHARALQLSGRMGRRFEGLAAIRAAARIRPSPELRNEAISLLSQVDLQETSSVWPIQPPGVLHAVDRQVERYVAADEQGTLRVFRLADNQQLFQLRADSAGIPSEQGGVTGLQFSPNGRYLSCRFTGGALVLWDLNTLQPLFRSLPPPKLIGYRLASFSLDSRHLGFLDFNQDEAVTVVDTASGKVLKTLQFARNTIFEFKPGEAVITIRAGRQVELWNWETEQLIRRLPHPAFVRSLAWSTGGRFLAVACSDGQLHLWDLVLGQAQVLSGNTALVDYMLFNNDDTLLTTVGLDGVCRLWEPASGRLLITGARGHGIAFSPDGERIAFERPGKSVGMWKLERGTGFRSLTVRSDSATQLRGLTLSPDGRWLVAASDRGVHIWDLPANAGSRFIARANLWAIDFAPDGNSLLMTSATNVVQCQFSALLPATAGDLPVAEVFRFPQEISVFCVAFSPDLQRAVVAAADTRAAILDRPPRDELTWLTKAPAVRYPSGVANLPGARTVAFSPDGRWVAHGEYEGGPGIWDAATGKLVRHLKGVNGTVRFDDDGRRLLVGSYDEYQWWDLQDPAQAYPISREGDGATLGVSAIDQAHHCLATVRFNQSIRLSSLSNQTEYASFAMPDPQTLNGLSFGAQGTLLIAPTRRDSIYVWNIPELRRGLSALNLDWDIAAAGNGAEASASRPAAHLAPSSKGGFGAQTFVLGLMGVAGTGVAGFLGLLVLRRHQWLAREFLQAEELVLTRERELRVEQEISRVKGHFVSMVSHEFRTPLGVISSSAEILRRYFDRLTEEGRREHLADITESVGRMKDLMEGVLLLGRVEAGKMECRPLAVDVSAMCQRVIEEVSAATESCRRIEFTASDLEQEAMLDEKLVQVILANLLSNALKYSGPDSTVEVAASRQGAEAVLEVRDTGIGIPLAEQADVFKSFQRGSNVTNIAGSGLGLTIVKRCVDLHKGAIALVSEAGQGTTVTVRLPAFGDRTGS